VNCLICKDGFENNDTVVRMIVAQFINECNYDQVYSGLSEYGEVHLKCLEGRISGEIQSETKEDVVVVRTNILEFLE